MAEVAILGAGSPASGRKPSALKPIGRNLNALDWQIASLASLATTDIHFIGGYHVSDVDLPYGAFITRLVSLRADIAFTNAWYWENFLQYDNVSNTMGLNSILRWVPRAGREVLLVVNREFVDHTRDYDFRSVSGDLTFKFSYTFRF